MSFVKTDSYFQNRIKNANRAISGTREALKAVTLQGDSRAVEANSVQLDSHFRELKNIIADYEKWITSN